MIDKVILGTAQLGMNYGINNYGKLSKNSVFEILDYAYKNDIRVLDTAEIYGESLELIGLYLKSNPQKKFKIISKINPRGITDFKQLSHNINKSLKILNQDAIHGYMLHSYKDLKNAPVLYEELQIMKAKGYINNVGISLYENFEISDITENYSFDFIQIPFNLLDNERKRGEVLRRAKNKLIDVHVRSIFLQGLFFKPYSDFNHKLQPLMRYLKDMQQIAKIANIDLSTLAIHYALKKDYIDKVIFGVHNVDQFSNNITSINKNINVPDNKIEEIDVLEEHLLNPYNWN